MTRRDTKAILVSVGMELFAVQGYNATGIGEILKRAGVPKGSFYHYFESKEEFAVEILEVFTERFFARLDHYLLDDTKSPLNRLRAFLEKGMEQLEAHDCTVGSLIGNLGQGISGQCQHLRERLERTMGSWVERFAACLKEAQDAGEIPSSIDPRAAGGLILTGWEGAVLRSKVMRSAQPFRDFIDILFGTVLVEK